MSERVKARWEYNDDREEYTLKDEHGFEIGSVYCDHGPVYIDIGIKFHTIADAKLAVERAVNADTGE